MTTDKTAGKKNGNLQTDCQREEVGVLLFWEIWKKNAVLRGCAERRGHDLAHGERFKNLRAYF